MLVCIYTSQCMNTSSFTFSLPFFHNFPQYKCAIVNDELMKKNLKSQDVETSCNV